MEIITTITYNEKNHSTIDFIKKYFAKMAMPMMDYETVEAMISNRSIVQSIESIIKTKWRYTKMVGSMVAGQCHQIELTDNAWIHIYLLENAAKDKFMLYLSGQDKVVMTIDLAYVGKPETFKKYTEELTISDLEVYSGLIHLEEGE